MDSFPRDIIREIAQWLSPEEMYLFRETFKGVAGLDAPTDPKLRGSVNLIKYGVCLGYPEICALGLSRGHKASGLDLSMKASARGHIPTLEWLQENGLLTKEYSVLFPPARDDDRDTAEWLISAGCPADASVFVLAASCGSLEVVKLLHAQGCERRSGLAIAAASNQTHVLEWAWERGDIPRDEIWNDRAAVSAAELCQLDSLKWAYSKGFAPPGISIASAAKQGNLDMSVWLFSIGVGWNTSICRFAVYSGNLEFLKQLRARGCPWDYSTRRLAELLGRADIVQYYDESERP